MESGLIVRILVLLFGPSWKTSLLGFLAVVSSLIVMFGADLGFTEAAINKIMAGITMVTGGGLWAARDKGVSTEQQKAGRTGTGNGSST